MHACQQLVKPVLKSKGEQILKLVQNDSLNKIASATEIRTYYSFEETTPILLTLIALAGNGLE